MADLTSNPTAHSTAGAIVPPYPPSFVDRFTDWVDRLPIPWWLFYVLLALAYCGAIALVLRQTGVYAAVGFHPMQIWLPTLAVYLLALTHALDHAAASAMQRFRPAFPRRRPSLCHRCLPHHDAARPADAHLHRRRNDHQPSTGAMGDVPAPDRGTRAPPVLFLVILTFLYLSSYPFFFHIWYQLREIHRLHHDHAQVRLSTIRPMYALSPRDRPDGDRHRDLQLRLVSGPAGGRSARSGHRR